MDSESKTISEEQLVQLNRLCDEFESACRSGNSPHVEAWLTGLPDALRGAAFEELLTLEVAYRQRSGSSSTLEELVARFPHASRDWLEKLCGSAQCQAAGEIPTQLGDYRIMERIGRGGMGAVYKAVHQRMGRTVALKLLRREMQGRPELLRRFNREVRAAARLTHPNIVAALDAREEGGLHYLITEYVP
ncbi:MAG: protein kinase, partial [Planctomycetota bacterium]|nr:protein kinase [Planctomycetota bacterium]